jgi:hypothetical protein
VSDTDAGPPSSAETPGETPGRRSWVGRVFRALLGLLALVLIASVAGTGALLYPYVRDDAKLDHMVRAVALDWRDFGFRKAGERMEYELAHQGIASDHVEKDCRFSKEDDGSRVVSCTWGVVINGPGGWKVPVDFESRAELDPSGELR